MGKETGIAWTDHTFNAWHGCEKVSPACTNCYAEAQSKRYGFHIWGKTAPRRFFGQKHWNEPHRWDIGAKVERVRRRVFVNSMSDTFEDRRDLDRPREQLWDLIDSCSGLDFLLLTKRPENILRMIPPGWRGIRLHNVWYGTTVENQEQADKRIPELLKVPTVVRFLSCEPLLGPVNLTRYLMDPPPEHRHFDQVGCDCNPVPKGDIGWIIAGGESGHGARPTPIAWLEQLRDQCAAADVPFFLKQLGKQLAKEHGLHDEKGGDPGEWPEDLRVQQFPITEQGKEIAP